MNKLENSKKKYDNIPIPKELNDTVLNAIKNSKNKRKKRPNKKNVYKWGIGAAAALVIATTIGANTSQTFAMEMQKVPVIGSIVKVLTIRSYENKDADKSIYVEIPSIEVIEGDTNGLTGEVNEEILAMCNAYADSAVKRAEEYKKAFMETGGTLEEWEAHKIEIRVSYEIKNQSEEYLSFVVRGTESFSTAYSESKYYNLDLKTNEYVTLDKLLGENYIEVINQSILEQIKLREASGDTFFLTEEGGFVTIDENSKFYINEAANPVIVFGKYEIAPGSMGEVEFEISQKSEQKEDFEASKGSENIEKPKDNFEVASEGVIEFAKKVKQAVEEKSIEQLADLVSYPTYVGFLEEGIVVYTKEEFLELDIESLFSKEMLESIAEADETALEPSMAGFTLYKESKEGAPSITFSLVDGDLSITGINY